MLELDHGDAGLEEASVAAMAGMGLGWDRILAEIAKGDVRCADCHRIATLTRGGYFRGSWSTGT